MSAITIVAGLGRCGSSLVMQMLAAGGHPIFDPDEARHPAYESPAVLGLPARHEFLQQAHGCALKVLDPHKYRLPLGHRYRIIWCDRDAKEQAKSQLKFLEAMFGIKKSRDDRRLMQRSNERDRNACLGMFVKMPKCDLLVVRFEDLLGRSFTEAKRIAKFVGLPALLAVEMAACVAVRSPQCYDGMMEFDQLENTDHA